MRRLGSPREGAAPVADLGGRPAFVAGQRVGRLRRRRTSPRRLARRAARLVLAALVPLALAGAGRWVVTTPLLAVARVDVRGASRVPADRILATAGITPGTNLVRLDVSAVVARLEALPEIRRARVVRELPDRVTILVEERRPFTLVHAARLHWLDEEGRVLGEAREAVAPPAPVISGLTEDEIATLRTAPTPKVRAAVGLIRALLRSGSALASEISEIDMSRREGPVLYTVDGVEVRLGSEDWDARLARLEAVLAQVGTRDVRTVDLRFRDQVVFQKEARP